MNRNLHHTFIGLISSGVLALGLFAATPAALPGADFTAAPAASIAPVPAITARMGAMALQIDTNAATPAEVQKSLHASGNKSRRIRQSMAMPFFSFAPRG